MLKQWASFKQLIANNPTDFEAMHQHLAKLGEEDRKQMMKTTKENNVTVRRSSGMIVVDINKLRLKKISTDFVSLIGRNNKEMFRM